jgi:tyrosyl-tRNA synthetase
MTEPSERIDLIHELQWRGLLKDCTDLDGLRAHLSDPETAPRKIYAGFDPTADSLTIGNLVPIMLLAHVKRAGHTPIVVMGGGTGLIGDPSGKSAERQLNTPETIQGFIEKQRPIFSNILDQVRGPEHHILNNHDWLKDISYIQALRDIGKHFSVNMMMQKESVRARLTEREQGISYTEFSYMILQAYDFAHLYEHEAVTVQFGGSDQYGNIVAGADLIRRTTGQEDDEQAKAFGLTNHLVQKADGGKFGKTEAGAIWLTAARTSPYAYYQFWLNATDEDARNWIKIFTFLDQSTIESLLARHDENPGKRELQRTLAQQATSILHGEQAMLNAEAAGKALFSGDISTLDEQTMLEVFASVPTTDHNKADLNDGVDMLELLKSTKLAASNREAREFLSDGSVSINGTKIAADTKLTSDHLLHGSVIAIRRGKKKWHLTKWS